MSGNLCDQDRTGSRCIEADGETFVAGYGSLQLAVDDHALPGGSGVYVLKCREGWSDNGLQVDVGAGYELIITGGYSCDRSEKLGNSYINHNGDATSLTIASGTVVFENFALE
ncbi:MAG: hypothetical protein JXQ81_06270 [Desulfuromonadales bacterium]|nr:hypothetical protein [Desulfuromonadales bacterium]